MQGPPGPLLEVLPKRLLVHQTVLCVKPLYSETEWPKIAAYDLEADHWVEICLVCHVDEYGNRVNFPSVPEYLDWLFDHFPGDVVFAHAGGHYDHRFLIHEVHKRGWDFSTAISGGSIVILNVMGKSSDGRPRRIRFGDSYRLMPDSLEKIGKTVNLPKLEVDPSQIHAMSPGDVLDYCYRDCEIVVRGLQLMRQKLTAVGADFAFTLASIATRYLRRHPGIQWDKLCQKKKGKLVPHERTKLWDKACYDAYHGGRCEMFETGEIDGPLEWYDIVSSYPTSMLEPLPLYFLGYYNWPRSQMGIEAFLSFCGITECEVEIPESFLTVLPVKNNGRLTFPTGRWRGRWTNIELLEAIKHGTKIISVTGQWRFEPVPFMRNFVMTFYRLRQEAKTNNDEFGTYAYKILLNSSYGKLIETIDRRSYISRGEIKRHEREGAKIEATPTQGVYCVVSEEVGPFRHTAAGAYITALSRLRLFRKAKEMHDQGARILYCDTDSLMLDRAFETTGKGLGDWEHVGTMRKLELVLPKVYRAEGMLDGKEKTVYKCKGCPIQRKWEDPDMPEKRWQAFKNFRFDENDEAARILGKDGVTGFTQDVKAGSLMPRRRQSSCSVCKKTGKYKGVECLACGGKGFTLKPLVRSLRSKDVKRTWTGNQSMPLHRGPEA